MLTSDETNFNTKIVPRAQEEYFTTIKGKFVKKRRSL